MALGINQHFLPSAHILGNPDLQNSNHIWRTFTLMYSSVASCAIIPQQAGHDRCVINTAIDYCRSFFLLIRHGQSYDSSLLRGGQIWGTAAKAINRLWNKKAIATKHIKETEKYCWAHRKNPDVNQDKRSQDLTINWQCEEFTEQGQYVLTTSMSWIIQPSRSRGNWSKG